MAVSDLIASGGPLRPERTRTKPTGRARHARAAASARRHSLAVSVLHLEQHLVLAADRLYGLVVQVGRVEAQQRLLSARPASPDEPLVLLRQSDAGEVRSGGSGQGQVRRWRQG